MLNEFTRVTDTALMVAGCRAIENDRPDGLIRDRFAAQLAGERGVVLARASPFFGLMSVIVGLRSHLLDELIEKLVSSGSVETVANLGAGLDSRPWRLNLPAELRWVEVDSEEILRFKQDRLGGETPRCRLEQLPLDLNSEKDHARLLAEIGSRPAAIVTEGLLMYLEPEAVESLVREAPRQSGVGHWILDAERKWASAGGGMAEGKKDAAGTSGLQAWTEAVERLRPKDYLGGGQILGVFRQAGWRTMAARLQSQEIAGMPPSRLIELSRLFEQLADRKTLEQARDEVSGVYLLEFPSC